MNNKTHKRTTILRLFFIVLSSLSLVSCKKESAVTNPEGTSPIIIEAPIGFAVTNNFSFSFSPAVSTGPDFSNPATAFYFEGGFNAVVTWTITINDYISGAVKTITGTSNVINQSNASWNGSHDGLYYFNPGDIINATLTIAGSNIKLESGSFSITAINPFNGYSGFVMSDAGVDVLSLSLPYLSDYPIYITGPAGSSGAKLGAYGDTPLDPFFGGVMVTVPTTSNPVPSNVYTLPSNFAPIEGNGAYMLYGTDFNFDYFIAGIKAWTTWIYNPPNPGDIPVPIFPPYTGGIPYDKMPTDPSQLWLNIYIYGTGDVTSQFHWNIEEDDNGDHVHYDASEDVYTYDFTTYHTGWKLFSVPYSDFVTAASPKNGGKGNHIQQPRQITAFGLQVLSSPPGQTCKVIFDYPTITLGRPYNPNN